MSFDTRILRSEKFVPHLFAELEQVRAFPPGAIPEAAYQRMEQNYAQVKDVEVCRITYESNGLSVTGLIAVPKDVQSPLPIAVYNRGGNKEFGRLTLYNVMQVLIPLARAGYLVFASNYRGNDGGEGAEEFGGADVQDVLNLLSIARAHPRWDGKNAFMVGHSRGGMMTYLALKYGAEVNAAISIAGVSDLRQSGEERPEMMRLFHTLIPDASEEAFTARSALAWVEQLRVPLLLLHGDADDRVDVSHSIRLAEALEAAQHPHELVVYPGGNHALVRQWDDVLKRVTGWFTKHREGA